MRHAWHWAPFLSVAGLDRLRENTEKNSGVRVCPGTAFQSRMWPSGMTSARCLDGGSSLASPALAACSRWTDAPTGHLPPAPCHRAAARPAPAIRRPDACLHGIGPQGRHTRQRHADLLHHNTGAARQVYLGGRQRRPLHRSGVHQHRLQPKRQLGKRRRRPGGRPHRGRREREHLRRHGEAPARCVCQLSAGCGHLQAGRILGRPALCSHKHTSDRTRCRHAELPGGAVRHCRVMAHRTVGGFDYDGA